MTIAFIGHGRVGAPLADHSQRAGHRVLVAARDASADSVKALLQRNPALEVLRPEQAVAAASVVFLATPFAATDTVIPPLAQALAGKVLVDCTNPVVPGLSHGLRSEQSGSARLQGLVPAARVVKAFTIYGYENLEDNRFPRANVKPAMLFCGEDADAKRMVGQLIADLGWEPLDVGGIDQALHLEHMTLLWIRLVRSRGRSPHLVWAALEK
jgi:predicted dinucleotide-binding enzyme